MLDAAGKWYLNLCENITSITNRRRKSTKTLNKKLYEQLNYGGSTKNVVIRDALTLKQARNVAKNKTIAVIAKDVYGRRHELYLHDNGSHVIVGQRNG